MRFFACVTFVVLSTLSLMVFSDVGPTQGRLPCEKVKTGILPSGELYSLYQVSCGNSTTTIASMERRTRWCTQAGDGLSCYRTADQAGEKACSLTSIAASGD
jgi:hypothetical protein